MEHERIAPTHIGYFRTDSWFQLIIEISPSILHIFNNPFRYIIHKFAIVTEELKHMLYALQDPALAHDNEKCNSLMQRYNEMREVQSLMAKRLGDRVVLR